MSYSRWSNSVWYTYWSAKSGDTRDTQVFTVCWEKDFTYKELKENLDACAECFFAKGYRDKNIEELKGYMKEFIEDVEATPYFVELQTHSFD